MNVKQLLLRTSDDLKTSIFGKKIWRNALVLPCKKGKGMFGETYILVLSSSAVFCLQNSFSDFF